MTRAGVFIGVDRSGQLETLRDAAAGARRMYEWALSQGMPAGTHARLVTDEGGAKVTPDMVQDAIAGILGGAGVDQLVLYFAGHGVNINRGEQWLLTDAPVRTSAAVNVAGSVELARYCGAGHVVVISDACRVAPEGIQAQNVRGVDVFPNDSASERARPVDQLFACVLGRTAAEVSDPGDAARSYSALYTSSLLDALGGRIPQVLERGEQGDPAHYVKVRPLSRLLEKEVPRRVAERNLQFRVNQNPDAIITSDDAWLGRVVGAPTRRVAPPDPRVDPQVDPPSGGLSGLPEEMPGTSRGIPPARPPGPPPPPDAQPRETSPSVVTYRATRGLLRGDREAITRMFAESADAPELASSWETLRTFDADETGLDTAIKVRGARVTDVFAPHARVELIGDVVRVDDLAGPAASVLLRLPNGDGAVVPVIGGFVAVATFRDGELVDLAYEPSRTGHRRRAFTERAAEIRDLRMLAAVSSLHGRFRLDGDGDGEVARRMQYAKGIDPTLAVYAAYAYHDLQALDRIGEMSGYLRGDVGATFFDLELLARRLVDRTVGVGDRVVPFFPLLSQGWALLRAHRVGLHPALAGAEADLRDSLWTVFDANGVAKVRRAMETGDVR